MKKAVLFASVVLGLVLFAMPRTEACSTHGYVRASTLNEIFNGTGNNDIQFSAGGLSGNQLGNKNLDTSQFDDGHEFTWSLDGGKTVHTGDAHSLSGDDNPYTQLEGIIGDIELALDAQFDKEYAD